MTSFSLFLGLSLVCTGQVLPPPSTPTADADNAAIPPSWNMLPVPENAPTPTAAKLATTDPAKSSSIFGTKFESFYKSLNPFEPSDSTVGPASEDLAVISEGHHRLGFDVWGYGGMRFFPVGTRMAPNGYAYNPLATLDLDFNVGLLPNKKLYLFSQTVFWGQKATADQTHGNFDFTKREYDQTIGLAYNVCGRFEARVWGFAYNNLNRGTSPTIPWGYNDGIAVEGRYYLPGDIYDISKLGFLSMGYMPSKTLIGGDGSQFKPGFFARAYLTHDLHFWNSYLFLDSQLTCESGIDARLLFFDGGWAVRPFTHCPGLEFRVGGTDTIDIKTDVNRGLGYLGFRLIF